MAWLNEYLAVMTAIIYQHGGVVIRCVGDAIMAAFGVPIARRSDTEIARDAINAATCALAIQDALARLNEEWRCRALPVASMRIGINTGELLAGSLGSESRLEYTIHGDTVNTAARLESFKKETFAPDHCRHPCRVLLTAATLNRLGKAFTTQPIGSVVLKGKKHSTAVFELLSHRHVGQT